MIQEKFDDIKESTCYQEKLTEGSVSKQTRVDVSGGSLFVYISFQSQYSAWF